MQAAIGAVAIREQGSQARPGGAMMQVRQSIAMLVLIPHHAGV